MLKKTLLSIFGLLVTNGALAVTAPGSGDTCNANSYFAVGIPTQGGKRFWGGTRSGQNVCLTSAEICTYAHDFYSSDTVYGGGRNGTSVEVSTLCNDGAFADKCPRKYYNCSSAGRSNGRPYGDLDFGGMTRVKDMWENGCISRGEIDAERITFVGAPPARGRSFSTSVASSNEDACTKFFDAQDRANGTNTSAVSATKTITITYVVNNAIHTTATCTVGQSFNLIVAPDVKSATGQSFGSWKLPADNSWYRAGATVQCTETNLRFGTGTTATITAAWNNDPSPVVAIQNSDQQRLEQVPVTPLAAIPEQPTQGPNTDESQKQAIIAAYAKLDDRGFSLKEHLTNAEGTGANWKRIGIDAGVGVAVGAGAGVLTNVLVKKNQLKKGYEAVQCVVGNASVPFGETLTVGQGIR